MVEDVLKELEAVITKAQGIFLEENNLLKSGKMAEHAALMSKKGEMLKQLDLALNHLQDLRDQKVTGHKESIRHLQDRIMKLLMLDKENSQLLVKQSNFSSPTPPAVTVDKLEKLYKKL